MKIKKIILLLELIFLITIVSAFPNKLNIEGVLRDSATDTFLTGSYDFNLTLINLSTSAAVFSDNKTRRLRSGKFDVEYTNITPDIFRSDLSYVLAINGSNCSEHNLTAEPYAFFAYKANNTIYLDTNENAVINANLTVDGTTLHIDSNNGRVGIGTTSPIDKLSILSNNTNSYPFSVYASDGSRLSDIYETAGGSAVIVGRDASGVAKVYLGASVDSYITGGNIGIGTTSPSAKFQIQGNSPNGLSMNVSDVLYVNGSSGNVGISKSDPGANLEIKSSGTANDVFIIETSNNIDGFKIRENAGSDLFMEFRDDSGNLNVVIDSDSDSYFNGGNLGIGTTEPNGKLHVVGDLWVDDDLYLGGSIFEVNATNIAGNGSFVPVVDNKFNLSNSSHRFANLWLANDAYINGNVGIGITSPEGKLHISGNPANNAPSILLSGNVEDIAAESGEHTTFGEYTTATDTFTEHWRIQTGGNIGMGSSAPNNKLHLKVNTDGQGLTIQRNSTDADIYADLGFLLSTDDALAPQTYIRAYRRTGFADNDMVFHVGGTDIMYLDDNGNVGIGTTTPQSRLEVVGNGLNLSISRATSSGTGGEVGLQFYQKTDNNALRTGGAIKSISANTYTGGSADTYDSDLVLYSVGNGAHVEGLRIDDSGNVGIGTAAPGVKLDVNGTFFRVYSETDYTPQWVASHYGDTAGSAGYITMRRAGGTFAAPTDVANNYVLGTIIGQGYFNESHRNAAYMNFQVDGTPAGTHVPASILFVTDNGTAMSTKMIIRADGKVGIGTASPTARLHVVESVFTDTPLFERTTAVTNAGVVGLRFGAKSSGDAVNNFGGEIGFVISDTGVTEAFQGAIGAARANNDDDTADIVIKPATNGATNERMRITYDGKVGIGTTNPASKLQVNGTVQIGDGTLQKNITMTSPSGNEGCCGMADDYTWSCTAGACP